MTNTEETTSKEGQEEDRNNTHGKDNKKSRKARMMTTK
jgi:hypothetical protein